MTHTSTEQERSEFEAWYIAGARKSVTAFAEWSEIELREGCMRPDSGSYRIDYARIAWDAWQAARRAQVVPDAYLVYAKGSTRYWVVTLNPDDVPEIYKGGEKVPLYRNAAAPQPPEAAPVQLPEPVYTMRVRGMLHDYTPGLQAFDLDDGEHKLYTEHQVLAILAQHGIKTT